MQDPTTPHQQDALAEYETDDRLVFCDPENPRAWISAKAVFNTADVA